MLAEARQALQARHVHLAVADRVRHQLRPEQQRVEFRLRELPADQVEAALAAAHAVEPVVGQGHLERAAHSASSA